MRHDKEKLEKILDCIDRIKEYTQGGRDKFLASYLIQDGVVRNLQVIGEAIKDTSDELRLKNPDVDWSEWSRSRDKITHDYFEVDYEKVWNAVKDVLPLREKIENIHRRLVYKVPGDREQPSKLERKLKENQNPRPEPEEPKERDRDDDLMRY